MNRIFAFAAAALVLASCCCKEQPKGYGDNFGVELYSVRSLIGNPEKYAENGATVLKQLAEMGYKSVEPACYGEGKLYGVSGEQFKADCEAAGLTVLSSHVGHRISDEEMASGDFSASLAWWDECIACHKAAGVKYLVMPSMPKHPSLAELQIYCDYYNAIGKKCAENGIKFGYHSHSFEFEKVEDQVMYDYLLQHTDPELVFFQMDVYWAVIGKVSPVEYFQKYPGRFTVLHIKDHYEVGQSGMVGFDAIFRNVGLAGTQDYVVEMEGSSVNDIMETCRISINYLLGK